MNFIIHFTFTEFVEDLPKGSIVYSAALTQTRLNEIDHFVILSSEAALPGGTIHVVRLLIDVEDGDVHASISTAAADKFRELLLLKGMVRRQGMLLTEGLNDALQLYGKTRITYSLKGLDELIAKERDGEVK